MNIYMLWTQGEAAAPETVRRVIGLWRERNPSHTVRVLDEADMQRALSTTPVQTGALNIQAQADLLRMKLLVENGGVWADASLLPVQPLDDWLPPLVEPSGFFSFRQCGYDRVLGNWFLASRQGDPLLTSWYRAAEDYFSTPRKPAREKSLAWRMRRRLGGGYLSTIERGPNAPYPYFAVHYLLERLIRSDPEAAARWERMPVWPVLPTHAIQHARFHNRMTPDDFRAAVPHLLRCAPVQKLDWRHDWPEETYAPMTDADISDRA